MVDVDCMSGIVDFKIQFRSQLDTLYFVKETLHVRSGVSNERSANSLYAARALILL
jgi:hypothetical protein